MGYEDISNWLSKSVFARESEDEGNEPETTEEQFEVETFSFEPDIE